MEARIHRDVFSLFYNIWCNPQAKIYAIVKYLLENCSDNSHTWARHLANLAHMYDIEDPIVTLGRNPPTKSEYSRYILTKITVYHEKQLRRKGDKNSKMNYLNIAIKGLNGRPHPALLNVKTTHDVQKMRPHIKMLSGDYYTYKMKADYQGGSPHCRLCQESSPNNENEEDIKHILTDCSAYSEVRERIFKEIEEICEKSSGGIKFNNMVKDKNQLTQFILDCSSINLPTRFSNDDILCSKMFELSRDLCFSINKTRLEILKTMKNVEVE